jgi:N-acetylglucosamine kinase-like BadF-type ATPase
LTLPDGILGRGTAAGSNPNSVGFDQAIANLNQALAAAWRDAGRPLQTVATLCLALAGADRDAEKAKLRAWAEERALARQIHIVNDAVALLTAGTPEGWGVALISGTGSFAWGRNPQGETARTGGWGYLLGDEGSGYAVALAGLRAAAKAADGRGPHTLLTDRFLERLHLKSTDELIPAIYHPHHDRRWLASLADVVTTTTETGDPVALEILNTAAASLAELVTVTAAKLHLRDSNLPLAITGGLLLSTPVLQDRLRSELSTHLVFVSPLTPVPEPILGALELARHASN